MYDYKLHLAIGTPGLARGSSQIEEYLDKEEIKKLLNYKPVGSKIKDIFK